MADRMINLLPREYVQRRRDLQILRATVTVAAVVIVLLVIIFVFEAQRLSSARHSLQAEQDTIAQLQAQESALADFQQLQTQLQQKQKLLTALTAQEVRWSVVLNDISLVIPQDAWLTNLTGSVAATTSKAATGNQVLGQIELDGATFSHLDVATWLTELSRVNVFTFPYLTLSSESTINSTAVVTFNSSVQLSPQAFRQQQRGAERAS